MQAIPSQANITKKGKQPSSSTTSTPPLVPPHAHAGSLTPLTLPQPSFTPTETTVGYTPAAMTIVTDPFTLAPVTSAPTPTTLVTTPSPHLLHLSLPLLPPLHDEDQFYLDHYRSNLTGVGMSPIPDSELFDTVNSAILRHLGMSPHVQHVVIAYSALHLASTTPYPSAAHAHHLSTALHHKALTLEHFRPAIEAGVSPDNSEPLLATAAVLVTCSFALPAADPACRTGYNHIDLIAENFGLVKGTSAILQQHGRRSYYGMHESGETWSSINLPSPIGDAPWSEGEKSLQDLQDVIEEIHPVSETERNRRASLLNSLEKLRRCIEYAASAEKPTPITCLWLSLVQKDYINLLVQRDPIALALISHWAIHHRGNAATTWWASGWLDAFIMALQKTIGYEYKHLMTWCMTQLQRGTSETNPSLVGFVG